MYAHRSVEIWPSTLLKADADVEAGCGTVDPRKAAVGRAKPLPTNHEQWLRCGHCSSQFSRLWPLHRRQVTLFHLRLPPHAPRMLKRARKRTDRTRIATLNCRTLLADETLDDLDVTLMKNQIDLCALQ